MTASTPEQVHQLWKAAFAASDIQSLLSLYEPDAVLAPSPDEVVAGREAIAFVLGQFLALRPTFQMKLTRAIQAGDLAILYSEWELTGSAPDGSEVRMNGVTSDVVRRTSGGRWLIAIDNPFGGSRADVLEAAS